MTYHNAQNGWSVLKISSFKNSLVTVLIHQVKVFAGATMDFWGTWGHHHKYGEQFRAVHSVEKKPASAAALEKYLGSGLIKGVGPATAKKIISYFKDRTLDVFENSIEELKSVPGIAEKKLEKIKDSWDEHRSIRDVMIFLQKYGISTLFATKIFKTYGCRAIPVVSENPYRLAQDIYGIGFFSADKIALSMGFERQGEPRIEAGIKHILASSRDEGHCYLTKEQIVTNTHQLLDEKIEEEKLIHVLQVLCESDQIKTRQLETKKTYFYSKTLYFDELKTAKIIRGLITRHIQVDSPRIQSWVLKYCQRNGISLSEEQKNAVCEIPSKPFSILTGGPGCGKTTCTKVLVALLKAMKLKITLAAPTGRAAQRMTEIIGMESKTIHRLLEWTQNRFKKNEEDPIPTDFLILDEVSMLDISLAASLLKALPPSAQVLFIGDPDQLPSVGAGLVLSDLLQSRFIPRFCLTKVFRQAQKSSIIRFAHEINSGRVPKIISPMKNPEAYHLGHDCLFIDADEATQDQLKFIQQVRLAAQSITENKGHLLRFKEEWAGKMIKSEEGIQIDELYRPPIEDEGKIRAPTLMIPDKFRHVDLSSLSNSSSEMEQLALVLKSIHPWSSLRFGLTAVETVLRVYTQSIQKWLGRKTEIQVLTPQVRGTLGTSNLNESLQRTCNPEAPNKPQLQIGHKSLRLGDRIIQTRNNYDLGVFNGDIGKIVSIDTVEVSCTVLFSGGEKSRSITFKQNDLNEIQLAYAITIHKSQGSEFETVIIPILGQHFNMLFRNLIYTGLTRAKKLAIFVGSRKALTMAIRQVNNRKRQTTLKTLVDE